MIINDNFKIGDDGQLNVESIGCIDLADRYGTPLYVMSKSQLLNNIAVMKNQMEKSFSSSCIAYASKALSCKEIYRIIKDSDMSLDVASQGELATALSVDFPVERIYFHGNNKNEKDLKYALEASIGYIVIDNLSEIRLLERLTSVTGIRQKVLLRVKPGVEAHTHEYIRTGGVDSKFGLSKEKDELYPVLLEISNCKGIELVGLHCHIGSQIVDIEPYLVTADIMLELFARINREFSFELQELNLGGGFGIEYLESQTVPKTSDFIKCIGETIDELCKKYGIEVPKIVFEPGRSVVGSAGLTLYSVGNIKKVKDIRSYVAIDGSIADNIRFALYQSDYIFDIVDRVSETKDTSVAIAGRCCETGDLIAKDILIQEPKENDILSVYPTGAYNYSMASNYNRLPKPAMVLVDKDSVIEIIRRETIEDLLRFDL
ncbi:MAG: diaminopimelate decarboxylase [Oscillospiraceae bacterium]|nr:diaminopimelate decarboxylase [Oscillospiraceae bacterium]